MNTNNKNSKNNIYLFLAITFGPQENIWKTILFLYPPHSHTLSLSFTDDRYNYIVNGTAEEEIQKFMSEEHNFEEYTEVSDPCNLVTILPVVTSQPYIMWICGVGLT